jgi:hypothetical protein
MFTKQFQARRSRFKDLWEHFGTKVLQIETFKKTKKYKDMQTGMEYCGPASFPLWAYEKLVYCSICEDNKSMFEPEKYADKIKTVVDQYKGIPPYEEQALKEKYEAFLNRGVNEARMSHKDRAMNLIIHKAYTRKDFENLQHQTDLWSAKFIFHCGLNHEKYCKLCDLREGHRNKTKRRERYEVKVKKFNPHQKEMLHKLENQDNTGWDIWVDNGETGKTFFAQTVNLREEILVVSSGETKRIAAAWDEKTHEYIVITCEANEMRGLNTGMVESLKGGIMFASMFASKVKTSAFVPKILIIGNEMPDTGQWSGSHKYRLWSTYSKHDQVVNWHTLQDGSILKHDQANMPTPTIPIACAKTWNKQHCNSVSVDEEGCFIQHWQQMSRPLKKRKLNQLSDST